MEAEDVLKKLESLANPKNVEGMARFGIRPKTKVLGIPIPELRKIAKSILQSNDRKKNHKLAFKIWNLKIHEARILAGLIADPILLSAKEIEKCVKDFDSWDVVDQVCMNLFDKSKIAVKKIPEFAKRNKEFEKRTAFALMAALASHDKKMQDKDFIKFFPIIKRSATDERNFVCKAVNWALRGIGKRNRFLNKEAIKLAKEILNENFNHKLTKDFKAIKTAKWIANNAIKELLSNDVSRRLQNRG